MKVENDSTKLRGGYYTPPAIGRFLAEWGVRSPTATVLEPSCGDGNLVVEAISKLKSLGSRSPSIKAFELFESEASTARARARKEGLRSASAIECGDFFTTASRYIADGVQFDLVLGNPPFVRYQDFPETQRLAAFSLMRHLGLQPSRLANAWLPFLAVSSALVGPKGRLAMVIPAELFQVGYAAELRQFLARYFSRLDIVTFERLVFPEIQQEVVLLLAERGSSRHRGIRVHEMKDAECLATLRVQSLQKQPLKPIDHASEKWTKYFLDAPEIDLLRVMRERSDIQLVARYLQIDVGVVTGDNDFFLLDDEVAAAHKLSGHTVPIVGRSAALKGVVFSDADLREWAAEGRPTHLFYPTQPYPAGVKKYAATGEQRGVNKGYKCRIRKEWFIVPSVWTPDMFYLRQADQAPRMIVNKTAATCTDTLHRGRVLDGVSPEVLAVSFMNSLTWAASEVTGRSYGGGVMTYEPSEVERLPLPVEGAARVDVDLIDRLVREKRLTDALDVVDKQVLVDTLGISKSEVRALRGIWEKLRNRRRGRKAR